MVTVARIGVAGGAVVPGAQPRTRRHARQLQWTAASSGSRYCLYVHHDDAEREYAYDRKDALAKLDKGWDEALAKGWMVVSMKDDWKTIFPRGAR